MTDTEKIEVIDAIVSKAYEFEPKENKNGYYEGIVTAIFCVVALEDIKNGIV